jgi:hypothetical protein
LAVAGSVHRGWVALAALVVAAPAIVLLLISGLPDLAAWMREQMVKRRPQPDRPRPVFTGLWRHTTEGIRAPGLMTTLQKALTHPGYHRREPGKSPPTLRLGVMVACDRLAPDGCTTSELRDAFLELLSRGALWEVVKSMTHVTSGASWHLFYGNGRMNNGAILAVNADDPEAPVAHAILNLTERGVQHFMQDGRCAELLMYIEPRDRSGAVAPAQPLSDWFQWLLRALKVPAALATLLSDLGLGVYDDPPAQLGVRLDTSSGLSELINIGQLTRVPGSPLSTSFFSYILADRSGKPAPDAVYDLLRAWCDHALYVTGYEQELDAIRSGTLPRISQRPPS